MCLEAQETYRATRIACVPHRFETLSQEWVSFKAVAAEPFKINFGQYWSFLFMIVQMILLFWIGQLIGRGNLHYFENDPRNYIGTNVEDHI